MNKTSIKIWPLLALCSLFYAILAPIVIRQAFVHSRGAIEPLGMLALAAGVSTIAAGVWNWRQTKSWFLVLNGLACGVLGMAILLGAHRSIRFRTIAELIVVMAASIAIFEFANLRGSPNRLAGKWPSAAAGALAVGFAAVFLGFVLGWIKLHPSPSLQTFYWLASYFGFSALCMLGLALGQFRPSAPLPGIGNSSLPAR
jgi:uncharacterized membrane protein HdeD (DUF308 family)